MNDTLYDVTRELFLLKNFEDADLSEAQSEEERLEQLKKALDTLNMKFLDKVTNIVKFVKNLEAFRDAAATEAKRLSDRKKSLDSRIEWLKNYVKTSMQAAQNEKIKDSLFTIYVGQSQPSVEVTNIDEVETQFIKTKKEVDKTKILDQVKSTGVIPSGVNIVQGTHLVIR